MYKNDKVIRRYSEPFKLKILDELTTGKLNKYQLGKAYGINPSTINEWIKKYNRKDLMNTRVTVKTKDESNYSANLGIKGFSSKLSCIALSTG